jgi:hypothetical protein
MFWEHVQEFNACMCGASSTAPKFCTSSASCTAHDQYMSKCYLCVSLSRCGSQLLVKQPTKT